MAHKPYPSALTEEQWGILSPLLPSPSKRERPLVYARREIVNALGYVLRGGCAWCHRPHDLPPWPLVYYDYRRGSRDGTWTRILDVLRGWVRQDMGREATPSAALIDSQSVKTTEQGGPRGDDAGQQVKGHQRHILVDTEGFLLEAVVHPADVQDRDGARLVLARLGDRFPICGSSGLTAATGGPSSGRGSSPGPTGPWRLWRRPPRRRAFRCWVGERTFAWLGHNRRLSLDYERLCETSAAWLQLGMICLLLGRLCPE